jgi:hypothetical protein
MTDHRPETNGEYALRQANEERFEEIVDDISKDLFDLVQLKTRGRVQVEIHVSPDGRIGYARITRERHVEKSV